MKEVTLGDLCEIIGGGTPSKSNPNFYTGDIPWATVRDMRDEVLSQTDFKITKEAIKASSTNIIPKGSVLIATRVGLGKICYLQQDTAINQDLRGIIPRDPRQLDVRFLFWWFKSVTQLIVNEGTGATVQGVKLPFIKALQVPLPPLSEQKRIVALLDQAFEGIDKAIANTEKNLANARELFESTLNDIFIKKGEGWEEKKLSELIDISHGFAFKGKDFNLCDDESLPIVLTPGNYGEDAKLYFTEKNTKRFSGDTPQDYLFDKNDLTVVMTDLSSKMKILGKPAFIDRPNILHNQRIGRVSFKANWVLPRLVYYYLLTRKVSEKIKETSTGTMVRHTAPKRILSLTISLPLTSGEQDNIIQRLDNLLVETQALETTYKQKLNDLSDLKQSILEKAFSGELTSDDKEAAA